MYKRKDFFDKLYKKNNLKDLSFCAFFLLKSIDFSIQSVIIVSETNKNNNERKR
jgi:hypothetical protein